MKIVQANKAYLPHVGGIETIVQQIAEGAAQRGHDSSVVVCNDDRQTCHDRLNGVDVTYAGTLKRVSSFPVSPGFNRYLMRQHADILMMHEPFLLAGLAYLTKGKRSRHQFKRMVIWWHSDIVRQQTLERVYAPLLHQMLRAADAVIVSSPKLITSSRYLSAYKEKCHVVHYGLDPTRFANSEDMQARVADIRCRYAKPKMILFSGRLVYYKGVEYLVQAMQHVKDAHLVVLGSGPLQASLEQLAEPCRDRITFIPLLRDPDLAAMYKACDLFVLPSVENSEAFGIVQLEAMVTGKPVVSSDLETGVTYINQHEQTGLVVPRRNVDALADAINTLLADDDLRHRYGKYARERVLREFTLDAMLNRTLGLYKSLLAAPQSEAALARSAF